MELHSKHASGASERQAAGIPMTLNALTADPCLMFGRWYDSLAMSTHQHTHTHTHTHTHCHLWYTGVTQFQRLCRLREAQELDSNVASTPIFTFSTTWSSLTINSVKQGLLETSGALYHSSGFLWEILFLSSLYNLYRYHCYTVSHSKITTSNLTSRETGILLVMRRLSGFYQHLIQFVSSCMQTQEAP